MRDSFKDYCKSVHKVDEGETRSQPNNTQNDRVNLGLPSGVLWATCNIGASSPTDAGDYFAWGEKESKDVYGWETYKLCHGSYNSIFKYTDADGKSVLDNMDDVAASKLGGEWRMPTKEEMEELIEECEWEWKNFNGILGWMVTGKNCNSIFLPAAGTASAYRVAGVNELGRYWTSTRHESKCFAYDLTFKSEAETIALDDDTRFYGRSVRPVFGTKKKSSNVANTVSTSKIIERTNKYELNNICELVIRKLMVAMRKVPIYADMDMSIEKIPNGGLRIRQELNGNVYNDFDFLGSDGWIRYVRISGKELNGHYRTIGNSMEVFGMQVDNISHKGDYVECIINQTIFGR